MTSTLAVDRAFLLRRLLYFISSLDGPRIKPAPMIVGCLHSRRKRLGYQSVAAVPDKMLPIKIVKTACYTVSRVIISVKQFLLESCVMYLCYMHSVFGWNYHVE